MDGGKFLEWDYISGTLQPHLSFLLYNYLPYSKSDLDADKDKANRLYAETEDVVVLPTGSFREGLRLPPLIKKNREGVFESIAMSDVDMMIVSMQKYVGERNNLRNDKSIRYLLETENTHPGYTLLEIRWPNETAEVFKSKLDGSDKVYLSSGKVTSVFYDRVKPDPGQDVTIQGPALTFEILDNELTTLPIPNDIDGVHAFFLPQWPSIANEWRLRKRKSNWLSPDMVNDIAAKGCHVVAKGHPNSETMDSEWRFSFSFAETMLAKQLTKVQIQCYLLLKTLHNAAFKEPKGIVSYHLKTIFFWTAEQIPQQMWTENSIGQMLILLLDHLLHCLVKHNLPSYFIPVNNLIDAIPVEIVKIIKQKVSQARQHPLRILLQYNKRNKFKRGPILSDLDEVYQPALDHGQNGSNASCSLLTCFTKVFIPMAIRLLDQYLLDFQVMYNDSKASRSGNPVGNLDAAIAIVVDVCRLAVQCGYAAAHPAVLLAMLIPNMTNEFAVVKLCHLLLERFPNAPNKEIFLQKILGTLDVM